MTRKLAIVPVLLATLLSNVFAGGHKAKTEAENEDWWSERATFFQRFEFTLQSTSLVAQTGQTAMGVGHEKGSEMSLGAGLLLARADAPAAGLYWDTGNGPGLQGGEAERGQQALLTGIPCPTLAQAAE